MGTITSTPSDMFTSPKEGARSYKVATLNRFDAASEGGLGYAASVKLTIPANTDYSVSIEASSEYNVRFARANGVFIEYYRGESAGEIVQLGEFDSLNGRIESAYSSGIGVYSGHPTGQRVISNAGGVTESYYPNGSFSIELSNQSDEDVTTFFSVGIEFTGDDVLSLILTPSEALQPDTQMGDYNGIN